MACGDLSGFDSDKADARSLRKIYESTNRELTAESTKSIANDESGDGLQVQTMEDLVNVFRDLLKRNA